MTMSSILKAAIISSPITVSPAITVTEARRYIDTVARREAVCDRSPGITENYHNISTESPTTSQDTQQISQPQPPPPQNNWDAEIQASYIVVLDAQGHVVGMLTTQQIEQVMSWDTPALSTLSPHDIDHLTVCDVMVSPVAILRSADCTNLTTLMDLFQQPSIHCLPIVDDADQFLGLISRASLSYAALQWVAQPHDGTIPLGEKPCPTVNENPLRAQNDSYPSQPHSENAADLVLEQLAARMADLEARAARANWEAMLTDLTAQICSSLDIQTILDIMVQRVQQVLGCDRVTIWQFETEEWAIAVAEATNDPRMSLLGQRINTDDLNLGQNQSAPNIHTTQFSAYYPDALVHLQSRDKLLVPLFCGDNLWGLLQVNGQHDDPLQQAKDIDLLQFLSMQLAIALQHATTHQQLQVELEERRQAQALQRETAQALQTLNQTLEAQVAERTLALQERENRYRALVEVMPDLMIRMHADGTYLDVVLGQETQPFNPSQFHPGANIYDITPAEHSHTRMSYVHAALATGTVQFYEYEWVVNGQPLVEEARIVAINAQEALVIVRNITERKRSETQLQKLIEGTAAVTDQDFFTLLAQHLAESLDVSYAVVSELVDGDLQYLAVWGMGSLQPVCSPNCQDTPCLRSLQEGMFYCESNVQQAFPDDADLASLNVNAYLGVALHNSQGEPIGNLCILDPQPIRAPQRAGQILRVFAARAAAELERQRARRALEQLNQALETKVAERTAALQEREARYHGLMEGAGDGILLCDRHGTVLEVNRKAEELLGYDRAELEGLDFQQLCPPEYRSTLATRFEQMLSQHYLHLEDGKFVAKGGKPIPIDISISVIEIQKKPIIQAVFRDISDRKQAEAILQQTNAELMRATRLKDEFLANMSHELRTPLNAILGMTEGLQDGVFGALSPKQIEALQTVERGGQHLLQLINDILDVAKIEAGYMAIDLAPTAIAPLCRSSLNFVKQQALKKRIQIETKLPNNLPDICLDERRIRQVLINLLNNAVKFTPEEGRITLAAHHHSSPTPSLSTHTLEISVTDTGIGISPEHINGLFQPFVQIDSALNRQYAGTGLGLALVKRIMELHQGTATVSSKVGEGSCFTITFPCKARVSVPKQEINHPKPVEISALPKQISPNILVVEDNKANVRTISSYLQARGYGVQVAHHGSEALMLIQNHPPDLVLMDIQMPEMDGLETIQYIRSHQTMADIPIIALTALAMEGDRQRCLAAGANDYLSKPVKLRLLASAIQQHLPHKNATGTDSHEQS